MKQKLFLLILLCVAQGGILHGQCDEAIVAHARQAIAARLQIPTTFDVTLEIVTREALSDLELSRRTEEARALAQQQAERHGVPFSFDTEEYQKKLIQLIQDKRSTIRYARSGSQFHVSASLPLITSGDNSSFPRESRYNGIDLWEIDRQNKAARHKGASGSAIAPLDTLSRKAMEDGERYLFDAELLNVIGSAEVLECKTEPGSFCIQLAPDGTPFENINLKLFKRAGDQWTTKSIRAIYNPINESSPLFAEIEYEEFVEVGGYLWPSSVIRTMGPAPSSANGVSCETDLRAGATYTQTIKVTHTAPEQDPDPVLFSFTPPSDYVVHSEGKGNNMVLVQDPNMRRLQEQLAAKQAARQQEMAKARQDKIESRLRQAGSYGTFQQYLAILGILATVVGLFLFWRTRQ